MGDTSVAIVDEEGRVFVGSMAMGGAQPVDVWLDEDLRDLGETLEEGGSLLIRVRRLETPGDGATLLHELVHAAIWTGLGDHFLPRRTEEAVVRAIENGLVRALRSNPHVAGVLMNLIQKEA